MERVIPDWRTPPETMGLQPHQVDVWRIYLSSPPASVKELASTLSEDETQRALRFHFAADRDRYIIAHGSLRRLLAAYLGCEPGLLNFSTNDYGKPVLEGSNLDFNLSHSGDYILIAVSQERRVGIDVERIRANIEHENLAARFFSQNEVAELTALPPEQKVAGFFNCWTRKEAYIKAWGLGLSLPLDSFDVTLTPDEPVLLATRPNPEEAGRWTLVSLDVSSAYAGALAAEGKGLIFRFWDWKPETIIQ